MQLGCIIAFIILIIATEFQLNKFMKNFNYVKATSLAAVFLLVTACRNDDPLPEGQDVQSEEFK